MWNGINRRKFPRAQYPCKIMVKKKDSSEMVSADTENIGTGGLCVLIPKDLGIFAPVEIHLDLQDTRPVIICDGTIVWIVKRTNEQKHFDTGIEFTNLKREDSERINFVVEKILENNKGH